MLSFSPGKKPTASMSLDDVHFIRDHYLVMPIEEIVATLGISAKEVDRAVTQLRQRGMKLTKPKSS